MIVSQDTLVKRQFGHRARLSLSPAGVRRADDQAHAARTMWNLLHAWWRMIPKEMRTLANADAGIRQAREDIDFLAVLSAQAAQAVLKTYFRAWKNCWEGRADAPNFKGRFHTVMSVMGGNSIANTVSVTPGGVGVNQATNVAALNDVTDAATATAYSLGQQLAITAWNIVFAVALVIWAFGWAGGRVLVEQSYEDAKVKVEEQKERRAATRATKRSARRWRIRRRHRGGR